MLSGCCMLDLVGSVFEWVLHVGTIWRHCVWVLLACGYNVAYGTGYYMYYVKTLHEGTAWQLCLTFGSAVQCMPGNSYSGFHIPAPTASGKRVISSLHSHIWRVLRSD